MILVLAVILGALTGWGISRWQARPWHPAGFRFSGLLLIGFLPQWLAFYFEPTRSVLPDAVASTCLVFSQILLIAFAILNTGRAGMLVLLLGLVCNFLVIIANGGFMPLVAESAARLLSPQAIQSIGIGERISVASKDVLLPEAAIILPWLADRFIAPSILTSRYIFSLGDVWIALGAFLLLAFDHTNNTQWNRETA